VITDLYTDIEIMIHNYNFENFKSQMFRDVGINPFEGIDYFVHVFLATAGTHDPFSLVALISNSFIKL